MKRITLQLFCLLWTVISIAQNSLSSEDQEKAIKHLKATQKELLAVVDGLNDEQINYKPNDDSWSVAECMEHIAISEKNLIEMIKMSLQEEADPDKRSEVAMTDDQILGLITSREQKVKTREEFEPTNSFGGFDETIETFQKRRKANIKFVKSADKNLRNYYLQFPFGLIDSYQGILFMSGHTERHIDQIREILASEGFPG
ncbi:DinB family protein [Ekhidna sp.]|uniref:DinB family protein n=1 Tax=Ekhidna sp. TaxID=2608089 RepID=UPI003B513443